MRDFTQLAIDIGQEDVANKPKLLLCIGSFNVFQQLLGSNKIPIFECNLRLLYLLCHIAFSLVKLGGSCDCFEELIEHIV
jgi:hypothetical protein